MTSLNALVQSERLNAGLGWLLTAVLALAAVGSALTDALLWAGFMLVVAAIAVLPPVLTRDWTTMVPWPLLFVAAAVAVVRVFGFYPEVTGYVAVATLALVVVVELDAFTTVEMSRRFAVGFAVLTTLAVQGVWTVAQYYSDLWVGTEFLRSQRELQVDIVVVTAVGLAMGIVFEWYFDRVEHVGSRGGPVAASDRP